MKTLHRLNAFLIHVFWNRYFGLLFMMSMVLALLVPLAARLADKIDAWTLESQARRDALPNPAEQQLKTRYFTLRYHVVVIDGAEYLVVLDKHYDVQALCPKTPKPAVP